MGALGIAAIVFLYFQFFSVEMIDSQNRAADKDGHHLPANGGAKAQGGSDQSNRAHEKHKDAKNWKNLENGNSEDCDFADCGDEEKKQKLGENINFEKHEVIKRKHDQNPEVALDDLALGDLFNVEVIKGLVQGAKRSLAGVYKPDNNNLFTCLHSKVSEYLEQKPYVCKTEILLFKCNVQLFRLNEII
jgi:hypothetical protein